MHSVSVTAANRADISELPNLLRENDQWCLAMPATPVTNTARGAPWGWSGASRTRPSRRRPGQPGGAFRQPENANAGIQLSGRVEHLFHRQAAVRLHQGALSRTAKNTAQVMVLIGLANLYACAAGW